jgi:glutamyl-Q tRNA(Asp) synthetase
VRIEDVDPPREQPGATDEILRALETYGFEHDGDILYQSESDAAHREALGILLDEGLAYECSCSRRDMENAPRGPLGIIYPGTCRNGCNGDETAVRVLTNNAPVSFEDGLQGYQEQELASETGDFVIWRRDGLVAYHLAVVVDDNLHGITEIVRGVDLLDSTPRQIWLQRLLQYHTPSYVHIPVATHPDGQKLSKLTGAPGVPIDDPRPMLQRALQGLRQEPPPDLAAGSLADMWAWATDNWELGPLAGKTQFVADGNAMAGGENGLL